MASIDKKLDKLKNNLARMQSVLVAYSGGVDSSLLLRVAKDVLGDGVLAVTAKSLFYPVEEIEGAKALARSLRVRHRVIITDELKNRRIVANSPKRCYWCKKALFSKLLMIAKKNKLGFVLDGTNYDDRHDFRPGSIAARELGIRSPLKQARLAKSDIRVLSKRLKLPTWKKPSLACLASRFPYGVTITKRALIRVNEAEHFLKNLGFEQVRVREHGEIARIEISGNKICKIAQKLLSNKVVTKFKTLGYVYVTLDLGGYRMGSLNLS